MRGVPKLELNTGQGQRGLMKDILFFIQQYTSSWCLIQGSEELGILGVWRRLNTDRSGWHNRVEGCPLIMIYREIAFLKVSTPHYLNKKHAELLLDQVTSLSKIGSKLPTKIMSASRTSNSCAWLSTPAPNHGWRRELQPYKMTLMVALWDCPKGAAPLCHQALYDKLKIHDLWCTTMLMLQSPTLISSTRNGLGMVNSGESKHLGPILLT